jgi:hypothetical protein
MISRAIGFCFMSVDIRTCFIVVTPKDLRVLRRSCSPRTGSIVLLLHSLLRGIQEWIAATSPILTASVARPATVAGIRGSSGGKGGPTVPARSLSHGVCAAVDMQHLIDPEISECSALQTFAPP